MNHFLCLTFLFFGFSFSAFAEASVKELLDQMDRLYRSDSSHSTIEMQIVTENWERTTIMEVWSRGMDDWEVNAKAPLRLTRLVFPYLRKSGSGRIIDIISMSGKRVKGNWVGYSMSKYAALAASHTARLQGWEDGIRVTNICPGFVQSEMTITNAPSFPQEKMSRPEDVAKVVSTLLLLPNESAIPEVMMNCVFETI